MSTAVASVVSRLVASHGLSVEEATELAMACFIAGVEAAPYRNPPPSRGSGADRQARYRERKRNESVTRDVTDVTGTSVTRDVTTVTRDVTRDDIVIPPLSIEKVKEKKERKREGRGSRLSDDWTASPEEREYARGKGLTDEQIAAEETKFRRYWIAVAGEKGVKRSWLATWQNWIDRSLTYQATAGPVGMNRAQAAWGDVFKKAGS